MEPAIEVDDFAKRKVSSTTSKSRIVNYNAPSDS